MLNLLLIFGAQGVLLSLALLSSIKKQHTSNFFLGLLILIFSLEILTVWAIKSGYTNQPNRFPFWVFSSYLILAPSLLLFEKINTKNNFKIKRWHLILFVPGLIEIITELSVDYINRYWGKSNSLIEKDFWFGFTEVFPVLALLLVLFIFGLDIKVLGKRCKQLDIGKKHFYKVTTIFLLFFIITLLWILEAVFYVEGFQLTLSVLCIAIFAIGYFAFYNPEFLSPPLFLLKTINDDSPKHTEREERDLCRLKELFEKEKVYLQPKLNVKTTATLLRLSQRRVSDLINKYHQMDFRSFVKQYRIREVIQKVEAGELKSKTLLAIALESGFNSKSSFNQSFKDYTGKSPSDYFKNTSN